MKVYARAANDPSEIAVVDPEGKTQTLKFDKGVFETDDPYLIPLLEQMTGNPDHPVSSKPPARGDSDGSKKETS
jgi:hypothetical protein